MATDAGRESPSTGELYDRYLLACGEGIVEDPDGFCTRHGRTGTDLHARVRELHRLMRRRATPVGERASDGDLPFERLGEFRLLRRLGTGGMGMIFLAEQESLGRRVALKIVRPDLQGSATAAERFRREAFAIARLRHPHIVQVHAMGEDAGVRYIAMELVDGENLDQLLAAANAEGRALDTRRVVAWMRDIARALHYSHERGVTHRDVKPANIRISDDGRPLLLDFGIARDERWEGQTLTRAFTGSPQYAAPEQLMGDSGGIDGRTDVYGLGVTLYQCVAGRVPFGHASTERIFHQVLTRDPIPPRRLNPSLPRDLELVVLKALEKDAANRYESAAALADDLDAILEHRPTRVRPPGPVARLAKWSRRHPAIATGILGVLVIGLLIVAQAIGELRRRGEEARALVREARDQLRHYRTRREETRDAESVLAELHREIEGRYTTDEEDRVLREKEDEIDRFRREREEVFHRVLERLRRAEQLDPGVGGADAVRAELYFEKWEEARNTEDDVAAGFFRAKVAEFDHEDRLGARARIATLQLTSDPPGADVYLFRLVEQAKLFAGGEHRLVPVPCGGGPTPVPPGTFTLRVVRGAGFLRPWDLVLDVAGHPIRDTVFVLEGAARVRRFDRLVAADGEPVRSLFDIEPFGHAFEAETFVFERAGKRFDVGASGFGSLGIQCGAAADAAGLGGAAARVYRHGEVTALTLPPGLVVRATARPLFVSPGCRIGRTPTPKTQAESGSYLALVEMPGHEICLLQMQFSDGRAGGAMTLPVEGTTPPGFVYVESGVEPRSFWMMEREVTAQEYLAFLNDPATLRRVAAAGQPVLYPRDPRTPEGYWERREEGFALKGEWRPDWPVLGVSWEDAAAYAAWRTERARRKGRAVTFTLPTLYEWNIAAGGLAYPFGHRFRAKWVKSCYARPQAMPEPVLRFPIDESPRAIFDLSGSAAEWLDEWFDEARGLRRLGGGAWGYAKPDRFVLWSPQGAPPDLAAGTYGFRLVMRPDP